MHFYFLRYINFTSERIIHNDMHLWILMSQRHNKAVNMGPQVTPE